MNIRGPACRQAGFSLVELIVSVVIISLISGGALVYLNKFNSRQKLEKTKEEMVASIKLVQSYAKGRQLPQGSTESELKYVTLRLNGDFVTAYANNDVGTSYFSNKIVENSETVVTFSRPSIIFWSGNGRLALNTGGTAYEVGKTETITIQQTIESTEKYLIRINEMGQVEKVE